MNIVSESQNPQSSKTPGWVTGWERGTDPWHASAFVGTPAEGMFEEQNPRKSGWYALDWVGNIVGFVADGTDIEAEGDKSN